MAQEHSPLLSNDHSVRIDVPTLSVIDSTRTSTNVLAYGFIIVLTVALLALGVLAFIPAWPWKERSIPTGVIIILGAIFGFIQEIIVWVMFLVFVIIIMMYYSILHRRV